MKADRKKSNEVRIISANGRVENWPTRLHEYIESRRTMPFAWGSNDCCIFACDGILALTGLDPAAKMFRGKYRDSLGAARLLKKHGGVEAVAEKKCREFGWPKCHVNLARRGDVVSIALDADYHPIVASGKRVAHYSLGICIGALAAFAGTAGMQFIPMAQCRRAWRIG